MSSRIVDESIEYAVCYHNPKAARARPNCNWVDYTGQSERGPGRTDRWRSATAAEQAFLSDDEVRHLPYRILKIRTTVEEVPQGVGVVPRY